uniref:Uncharacterized protein n=1 Tax=Anas platyrhynchos platyrhynchos TaxID=8840 RepID=A0A493SZA9_ANAPP
HISPQPARQGRCPGESPGTASIWELKLRNGGDLAYSSVCMKGASVFVLKVYLDFTCQLHASQAKRELPLIKGLMNREVMPSRSLKGWHRACS